MPKQQIIGIGGVATVGKDTFYNLVKQKFPDKKVTRYAFADSLRNEASDFIWKNFGLDVWNLTPEEKLMRPFMVWLGCTKREFNPYYWVDKVNDEMQKDVDSDIKIITDVRFENEALWVKKDLGGHLIHIKRLIYGIEVPPANSEEQKNDPLVYAIADLRIIWDTVLPDSTTTELMPIVEATLKQLCII